MLRWRGGWRDVLKKKDEKFVACYAVIMKALAFSPDLFIGVSVF